MTPEELAEELAQMGFSSVADFIEADVADAFGNVTHNYAFSSDGKALFLDEPLPANKGVNELAGQTYNRAEWNDETEEYEDTGRTYVFTVDSCTDYESQTYSYAYDNAQKVVYLKKPTANRDAEYTASTNTLPGNFATAEERNAAQVNSQYRRRVITYRYDSAEKFIFY
jgi:hypothetical protein